MPSREGKRTLVNAAVFIILEVAALSIFLHNPTMQAAWIGRGAHNVMAAVWGGVDNVKRHFSLRAENDSLAAQNFRLQEQLRQLCEKSPETVWKKERVHFSICNASVVTATRGSQHNYLILDRGAADGVAIDDGIVTDKGVIGIVQSVSDHFCFAVSYASTDMTVSAKLGRSGSVGQLCWSGIKSSESILSGIPIHAAVEQGDTVYTSGFSSIFPADIPLGTVVDKSISNGNSAELRIRLLEDFSAVHYVSIVKNLDRAELKRLKEGAGE